MSRTWMVLFALASCDRAKPPIVVEAAVDAERNADSVDAGMVDAGIADTGIADAGTNAVVARKPNPSFRVSCPREGPMHELVGLAKDQLPMCLDMNLRSETATHRTYTSVMDEWDCRLEIDFAGDRVRSALATRKRSGRF